MSKKRTLSRWLRSEEVYRGEESAPPGPEWRETLLADYEHNVPQKREPAPEIRTPLQVHHLVLMTPAGVALFGLGWFFGSGAAAADQVARISPLVWVIGALVSSAGFMIWRGKGITGR